MTNNALHPAGRPSRRGARVPAILLRAGENAAFAADEFFSAHISNSHTRRAYGRAVGRFLGWCEDHNLELAQVTPGDAGRYIAGLEDTAPAQRQALAALRKFFDLLVTRHAVGLNSFSPVRGKRHVLVEGRTLEITPEPGPPIAGIHRYRNAARPPGPLHY